MFDKSSMLYWYPKIKDLPIPQPRTEILEFTDDEVRKVQSSMFDDNFFPHVISDRVADVISKNFSLPVFIRTDQASGKHEWKRTCFYDGSLDLAVNLMGVIEFNMVADILGLDWHAIVVREYIPMRNLFTAFYGGMPVNPEIRFFIRDGKILCWHWYWVEDSIQNASDEFWREKLDAEKKSTGVSELELLSNYAMKVAGVFPDDYWSVDFCKAKDGRWFLIDMAEGQRSWHQDGCPNKVTDIKEGN
jgi:hypothetical protein